MWSKASPWVNQPSISGSGSSNRNVVVRLYSAMPFTPEQLMMRALERKIKLLEGDNEILKNASALLMQGTIKGFR